MTPAPRVRPRGSRVLSDEFDALPAALVELDGDLRVLRVNRAAAKLLGLPPGHLAGTAFAGLAPPEERELLEARLRAVRRGHRSATTGFEAWLEHGGGGVVRARATATTLHRGDGDVLVLALDDRTAEATATPADAPFRALLETAPTAIVTVDEAGRILFANPAAEKLFGYRLAELVGRPVEMLVPERFRPGLRERYGAGRRRRRDVVRALRRDGTELPVEVSLAPAKTDRGMLYQAVLVDVTERVRAQEALERRARQQAAIACLGERALAGASVAELMELTARSVAEGAGAELVTVLEAVPWERRLVVRAAAGWDDDVVDEATVDLEGSFSGAALRADAPIVVDDVASADHPDATAVAGASDGPVPGVTALRAHGIRSAVGVAIAGRAAPIGVLTVASREPRRFAVGDVHFLQAAANVLADAIGRRRAEARTRHAALHDALTGLPNRALLLDRARQWERSAERGARGPAAVLFLDLDDFKLVNDSLGHEAGDELLRQVAERLRAAVRPADTVARFGGDEFVVLLEDVGHRDDVLSIVGRVQAAFAEPFALGTSMHTTTPSIGVALSDEHTGADALLRNADAAMYRAKRRGRARFELFDRALHRQLVRRLQLAADLRAAVRRGSLGVHFQPVVELDSGAVAGFEALARWRRDGGERVGPGEFIPIAEESGLVVELGAAVLLRAAAAAADWRDRHGDVLPYGVSVNLSQRQVSEPSIVDTVRDVLRRTGLPADRLALEITETSLMSDVEGALETFGALRDLGVRIILDDFGTGYSSLSHLKRFPIDTVKVDRLFVEAVAHDPGSRAIVAAVLSMARGFGADVVAEGVETEAQRAEVVAVGCRYAQGHLFARDLSRGEAEALILAQARRR